MCSVIRVTPSSRPTTVSADASSAASARNRSSGVPFRLVGDLLRPVGGAREQFADVLPPVGPFRALGEQHRLVVDRRTISSSTSAGASRAARTATRSIMPAKGAKGLANIGTKLGHPVGRSPPSRAADGSRAAAARPNAPRRVSPSPRRGTRTRGERLVIGRVGDQGGGTPAILDLAPLVEAIAADQPVRQPARRNAPRARATASWCDRAWHLAEVPSPARSALELAHDPLGLVPLVGGGDHVTVSPPWRRVRRVLPMRRYFRAMTPLAASSTVWVER